MKLDLRTVALAAIVTSLIASDPAAAEKHSAGLRPKGMAKATPKGKIITRPVLESATNDTAIVRWTANTGGGTDTHYGIVRYGTDAKHLDRVASSPNRWNKQTAPHTTYRVRINGLAPATTYYYTVDAEQADGSVLHPTSPIDKLTTASAQRSASP
jgi:phosphodiesterase/alkaline phosphatase D-like protein